MKLKFNWHTGKGNHHGTQKKGEPWNQETVRGWKLKFLDIRSPNSLARWYGRWILYRPSGACYYFDVAFVSQFRTWRVRLMSKRRRRAIAINILVSAQSWVQGDKFRAEFLRYDPQPNEVTQATMRLLIKAVYDVAAEAKW